MRILMSGYGKMGKTIERIAMARKHEFVYKLNETPTQEQLKDVDVMIDFSVPDAAFTNAKTAIESKTPVVMGTTGWQSYFKDIEELVEKNSSSFLYAANFSLGVNLFFQLNQYLASIMKDYKDYQPYLSETHHIQKLDAPSGTAIHLANDLIEKGIVNDWHYPAKEATANQLPIDAYREKDVKGTHELTYESDIDKIQIKHEAKTRDGFALGAVIAAEWLHYKKTSGIFTMQNVLKDPIKS